MDPTAAPVDLTIGSVTFKAYPLRDIDHEEFNKWIRREYVQRVKDSVGEDETLQKVMLSNVLSMTWTGGDGFKIATTRKGIMKMASLLCRGKQFPQEEWAKLEFLDCVLDTYTELHPADSEDEDEDGEPGGSPPKDPKP